MTRIAELTRILEKEFRRRLAVELPEWPCNPDGDDFPFVEYAGDDGFVGAVCQKTFSKQEWLDAIANAKED